MLRTFFALAVLITPALADLPRGTKTIVLKSKAETIAIGTIQFDGEGPSRTITATLNAELFRDHFLSMRPFKCLEGEKFYCHLPYPYAWKGEVTETDLADLEYALLFVQKEPAAYGINLWHGVYYKLTLSTDGRISGTLHEVDMDVLASPPADGELRPITPDLLTRADPGGQWLPELIID
jgi:hypothetical protein